MVRGEPEKGEIGTANTFRLVSMLEYGLWPDQFGSIDSYYLLGIFHYNTALEA